MGLRISPTSIKILTPAVFLLENPNLSGALGNAAYADYSVFTK